MFIIQLIIAYLVSTYIVCMAATLGKCRQGVATEGKLYVSNYVVQV